MHPPTSNYSSVTYPAIGRCEHISRGRYGVSCERCGSECGECASLKKMIYLQWETTACPNFGICDTTLKLCVLQIKENKAMYFHSNCIIIKRKSSTRKNMRILMILMGEENNCLRYVKTRETHKARRKESKDVHIWTHVVRVLSSNHQ